MDSKVLTQGLADRFARLDQGYREGIRNAEIIIRQIDKRLSEPYVPEDEWMALFLEVSELKRVVRKAKEYARELKKFL